MTKRYVMYVTVQRLSAKYELSVTFCPYITGLYGTDRQTNKLQRVDSFFYCVLLCVVCMIA